MRQLLSDIALIPDNDLRGKTFERAVKWLLENERCARQTGEGIFIQSSSSVHLRPLKY